ncbi:hypothetical protein QBC33DRAFT_579689 [Phialemonium atrogriseum]|uniref:Uncharacterized protein n=1 Tax=Phialemonium atrogriseum TaxID=1093897 RepID=A0AAJ0BW64_9PEZI|nr:uncharacterized protein QBC33DRAFT_579689 [Phialemonium atrogriseum]KAK1765578.1 hypothetical protein QBC33DRAFT_579689 [Phialemonium atrogriseum]
MSVLSKTLRSITLAKIHELESRRESYEAHKRQFLAKAYVANDERDRLACLLDGIKELYPAASKDPSLANMERWLTQSRYDPSIPKTMLGSFDEQLRAKLDVQGRKLAVADLYSRLLTEWLDQSPSDPNLPPNPLLIPRKQRLRELVDKFESVVFEHLRPVALTSSLFWTGYFQMRRRRRAHARDGPIDRDSLTRCIKGLLTEDLLSDEKQAILQDFLGSGVALSEIADVLNMRFSDLKHWQWDAGDEGIRVMPRQQLNGKYRIWADDDILQMISVQYIGIRLCNILKTALRTFVSNPSGWTRQYHTGDSFAPQDSVETRRKSAYLKTFFLSQLPTNESKLFEGGSGAYNNDDDKLSSTSPQKRSSVMQRLLRQLTSKLLIHQLQAKAYSSSTNTGSSVALVQANLQWYATSLPHSTIYSIDFFKKYLKAPLNLNCSSNNRPKLGPRIRKRGVPMAHASEKFTSKLVLIFIDFAVNRQTSLLLYQLHGNIWLCEFNKKKTRSVYLAKSFKLNAKVASTLPPGPVTIGFLRLDPRSAERFFSHHTFREPAYCFGRKHVDSIPVTYKRMQRSLFDGRDGAGSNAVDHLKLMTRTRFDATDIPDAFILLSEQLGGEIMREFLEEEHTDYLALKKLFETTSEAALRRRLHNIYPNENAHLLTTYTKLMSTPETKDIVLGKEVKHGLSHFDSEKKWALLREA